MIHDDCQQWLECQIQKRRVGHIGQEMGKEQSFWPVFLLCWDLFYYMHMAVLNGCHRINIINLTAVLRVTKDQDPSQEHLGILQVNDGGA